MSQDETDEAKPQGEHGAQDEDGAQGEDDEEEFAPTPFDGPYFMPVLLFALAAWFAYDGWFSTDASMQEYGWFNQGGAVIWAVLGGWYLYKARRDEAARS